MPPTVSVLLPVRDAATTLDACLRSLRRQTLPDWEAVVVDDGSADGSDAVRRAHARDDDRLRVVRGPARGIVPALLTGLEACRAPWVARMDADDVMHRRRLERQLAATAGGGFDATGTHVRLFPDRQVGAGMRAYAGWLDSIRTAADVAGQAFVECPLPHPTWMLRRDLLEARPWRDRGWPEDHDLVLRWLRAGHRLGVVPRRLLAWRQGAGRLSRTDARYRPEAFVRCRAHHLARGPLAGHPRYVLWGFGGTGRRLARALRAEGRELAAVIELHPGRLGNRIHGAPVLPPTAVPDLSALPLVVSVAGAGPRREIAAFLDRHGRRDAVFAA